MYFNTVVIVLMLLISTEFVFAQKQLKYVPKLVESTGKGTVKGTAKQNTRIPAVINPKLSLEVQRKLAESSGVVVNNATTKHTSPAVKARKPVSARKFLEPVRITTGGAIDKEGVFPSVEGIDGGTNLTGVQVLSFYFSTWRQELGGTFSKEQLDAVERTMAATDEWIFVRGEDGELQARNKDEWNYEVRFLTILQNSGVNFTERQIKQLVGGAGVRGFTFKPYFTFQNINSFMIVKGRPPRKEIWENGTNFTISELRVRARQGDVQAAELAAELELGVSLKTALRHWPLDSPHRQKLVELVEISKDKVIKKYRQQLLADVETFIERYGHTPRQSISINNKMITLSELEARSQQGDPHATELARELELGKRMVGALEHWSASSPEYQVLKDMYDTHRNTQTSEQLLANLKQFAEQYGHAPRQRMTRNGQPVTLSELQMRAQQGDAQAAKLADELKLGQALGTALAKWSVDSPKYQELNRWYNINRNQSSIKTHQQVIVAYKSWIADHPGTSPRAVISKNGTVLMLTELRKQARKGDEYAAELVNELELRSGIRGALQNWDKNSADYRELYALYNENRNQAAARTTEELYQDLVAHIRDYGHYPMRSETSLHTNIYKRLKYYQSTMVDGKYVDPSLQKIYELKQWSERVKRGEVDWNQFPGLFKKHRRTIGEMRRAGQPPSPEAAQELKTLSDEEQQAIEKMADNMLTLWENFEEKWWQENQKHIITTPNTRVAFDTVLNAVRHQVPSATNVNISNVLEQVNGMQLGQDGQEYYRVIYRGNNPRIPRAEDFHNVEEIAGLPQQYAEPAYKLNAQHISLDGDEESVSSMFLTQGVTDREMSAVIDSLTPAGWEVRIGAHEMLSQIKNGKVHIHIEKVVSTTEEDAVDTSYVLNVNLRQLTQGKNPQQVAKTLRYLFSKYLTEEGHQSLNNIQRAF